MARRSSEQQAAEAIIALVGIVIAFIVWILPYILQALAWILGALASFCVKYKKEIWRCMWESMLIGGALSFAIFACETHEGGLYYEIYVFLFSAANWFIFRSIVFQMINDANGRDDFDETERNILKIEKIKVINVADKIENKEVKKATEELKRLKTDYPVNIETCKKEDLMTLAGFDEDKAKKLIEERKNGKMWYSMDDFCQDFNPKPHELINIENRLIFPPKPNAKRGRMIDV